MTGWTNFIKKFHPLVRWDFMYLHLGLAHVLAGRPGYRLPQQWLLPLNHFQKILPYTRMNKSCARSGFSRQKTPAILWGGHAKDGVNGTLMAAEIGLIPWRVGCPVYETENFLRLLNVVLNCRAKLLELPKYERIGKRVWICYSHQSTVCLFWPWKYFA